MGEAQKNAFSEAASIFVNTIDHAIRLMTDNGVPATAHREERDGYIEYTVRIPTAAAQR